MHLYVSMAVVLPPKQTAELIDTEIQIRWKGLDDYKSYEISELSSGAPGFGIPQIKYQARQQLIGTERMSNLNAPYGPNETFSANIALPNMKPEEVFVIPPRVLINNKVVTSKAIKFRLKNESIACIQ